MSNSNFVRPRTYECQKLQLLTARMDLNKPLDLSRDARHLDDSGTPMALIELARRRRNVIVLDRLPPENVLVEFPMGTIWQAQTKCARFVSLRAPIDGKQYALVRQSATS